jgi:hypothetical protein
MAVRRIEPDEGEGQKRDEFKQPGFRADTHLTACRAGNCGFTVLDGR